MRGIKVPGRGIIRSQEAALEDCKLVYASMKRYGRARPDRQPADAQPFSVSSTQGGEHLHELSKQLSIATGYARPFIVRPQTIIEKMLNTVVDPRWMLHRSVFLGSKSSIASKEQIVYGSREALKRILEAIRKKNLNLLNPVLLDPKILPDIARVSNLQGMTPRQLSCLDVTDDDFIGVDGIVDYWRRIDLPDDDPCSLLSSMRIGGSEAHDKPILSYSVEMMALLRKNILINKMGKDLPPPAAYRFMPAPKAYGLPYMRILYATVEFAHKGTDTVGQFSPEPFLLNFHVHSF